MNLMDFGIKTGLKCHYLAILPFYSRFFGAELVSLQQFLKGNMREIGITELCVCLNPNSCITNDEFGRSWLMSLIQLGQKMDAGSNRYMQHAPIE